MVTRIINYSQRLLRLTAGSPEQHGKAATSACVHLGARMDLHLQPDWQRALGQRVEIWKDGKFVRKGTVEAVMPDNAALDFSGRNLFETDASPIRRIPGICAFPA